MSNFFGFALSIHKQIKLHEWNVCYGYWRLYLDSVLLRLILCYFFDKDLIKSETKRMRNEPLVNCNTVAYCVEHGAVKYECLKFKCWINIKIRRFFNCCKWTVLIIIMLFYHQAEVNEEEGYRNSEGWKIIRQTWKCVNSMVILDVSPLPSSSLSPLKREMKWKMTFSFVRHTSCTFKVKKLAKPWTSDKKHIAMSAWVLRFVAEDLEELTDCTFGYKVRSAIHSLTNYTPSCHRRIPPHCSPFAGGKFLHHNC